MSPQMNLVLKPDLVARLRDIARRSGRPFEAVLNDAIRVGLDARDASLRYPFGVEARTMGVRPGIDLDDIAGLLERVEGPDHR